MCQFISTSENMTQDLAALIASGLKPGAVLLLRGELGAGKTAFVRGLARGLGANEDDVSSPTFALMQQYLGGDLPLYHFDLYRLSDPEAAELGFEEYFFGCGVCAIEWPDSALELLRGADVKTVRLARGENDDTRIIDLEGFDALPEPGRFFALGLRRAD